MKKQTTAQELKRLAKVARFRRGVIGVLLLPVGYFIGDLWQLVAHATATY